MRDNGLYVSRNQSVVIRLWIDVRLRGLGHAQGFVLVGDVLPLDAGADTIAPVVFEFSTGVLRIDGSLLRLRYGRQFGLSAGHAVTCIPTYLKRILQPLRRFNAPI